MQIYANVTHILNAGETVLTSQKNKTKNNNIQFKYDKLINICLQL